MYVQIYVTVVIPSKSFYFSVCEEPIKTCCRVNMEGELSVSIIPTKCVTSLSIWLHTCTNISTYHTHRLYSSSFTLKVKSTGKGPCPVTCMSKDKNMQCCRGHRGWNASMVPVVSCPLEGDDMQRMDNWVTGPNPPWPKGCHYILEDFEHGQDCLVEMYISNWVLARGWRVSEGGLVRGGIQMIDEQY